MFVINKRLMSPLRTFCGQFKMLTNKLTLKKYNLKQFLKFYEYKHDIGDTLNLIDMYNF